MSLLERIGSVLGVVRPTFCAKSSGRFSTDFNRISSLSSGKSILSKLSPFYAILASFNQAMQEKNQEFLNHRKVGKTTPEKV